MKIIEHITKKEGIVLVFDKKIQFNYSGLKVNKWVLSWDKLAMIIEEYTNKYE